MLGLPFLALGLLFLVRGFRSRLTPDSSLVTRRILWFMYALVAASAAVAVVHFFLSMGGLSRIERDSAAGFNGSFEVMKEGLPANWYVYHQPLEEGDAELSFDAGDAIDGNQSLKLLVHRVDPVGGWHSPGLFQVVEAESGRSYQVSLWLKSQGGRIRLKIDSELPQGQRPRNPITEVIEADGGEIEWRQHVYEYTVPDHYANIRLELNVLATGTVWIDDVRIESTP